LVANTVFTSATVFGLLVRSSNGVPVVSGVEVASGPDGSPGKESPEAELLPIRVALEQVELPVGRISGLSVSPGIPNGSRHWLLALPQLEGEVLVAIQNAGQSDVKALISRYGSRGRYEVKLAGFGIHYYRVAAGNTLEIRSDSAIAVTALHQEANGAGLNSILGIRFAEDEE
ncbi:MAG: hypothetical protein QF637_13770, partial [Acidimicrobiales bacterium]|nr:hypothetical protein [Acidimicrobiales bacterium]